MNVMRNIPPSAVSRRCIARRRGKAARCRATLELLKPITWFAPMWAFGCGVVSSGVPRGGPLAGDRRWASCWPGRWSAATSQAVNDWFDRHVDAINEPNRPIPSGRMPGRRGLYIAIAWTRAVAAGRRGARRAGASAPRSWAWSLAWAYSAPPLRLKRNGWWGNTACAACYEGLPWITGAAVMAAARPDWRVARHGRAVQRRRARHHDLNDFKSVEGDRRTGIFSLPVLLGAGGRRATSRASRWRCRSSSSSRCCWRGASAARSASWPLLLMAQLLLMVRLLQRPRERAPWYNAHRHHALRDRHAGDRVRTASLLAGAVSAMLDTFDAVVVGGGPAGATAASELARRGLLGAAAGPRRPHQAVRRRDSAATDPAISPFPTICWLRASRRPAWSRRRRARWTCRSTAASSAWWTERCSTNGCATAPPRSGAVRRPAASRRSPATRTGWPSCIFTRRRRNVEPANACAPASWSAPMVPDPSVAAQAASPGADRMPLCLRLPRDRARRRAAGFDGTRCDVYYQGRAVTGLLRLGVSARRYGQRRQRHPRARAFRCAGRSAPCGRRRASARVETIRREGAPIPLRPLRRWDNGRDVIAGGRRRRRGRARRPARASTTPWKAVGLPPRPRDAFLATGDAAHAADRPPALHARTRPGVLDPCGSCSGSGIPAISGASASSASAATPTCSASPGMPT